MHLQIKVKPNSKKQSLEAMEDGTWCARLKAPPVDGKANQELIELLSKHFGCSKAAIQIKSGGGSKLKLIFIDEEIGHQGSIKKK